MSASGELERLPEVWWLFSELSQYPILADEMRERMRHELFTRGVITSDDFEREVREKAVLSQRREGIEDPYSQEPAHLWERRLHCIRDSVTDSHFAHNLPHDLFADVVQAVLTKGAADRDALLSFNPELAPQDVLFAQAEKYEAAPAEQRPRIQHHLQEIKVVLIRRMVSDQLPFVSRAKNVLSVSDLKDISTRRIGMGKIGGKAAGMLLAWQALQRDDSRDPMDIRSHISIPDSYFIGTDAYYEFKAVNRLVHYMDQKYKTREEIEEEHPQIVSDYLAGRFPEGVVRSLRGLLAEVGKHPLIVRSSSLLEDSFGTSFAGKYDSFFCPNQGSPTENLRALTTAVARIYASVLSPDALLYRRHQGLIDYDERMAILIQKVQGTSYRNYYFPTIAGVAFGRNPFRWTQRIRREDGFLRLVWGLGTRAVDRVPNDHPRMVALSHPGLRPEKQAKEIHKYSQHYIDLLDLEANVFRSLPVAEVVSEDYAFQHELFSLDQGDWIQPIFGRSSALGPSRMVLTFDHLLAKTGFVTLMRAILKKLERQLDYVPDLEFTLEIAPDSPQPHLVIHLLQCRPLSSSDWAHVPPVPKSVPPELRLFSAHRLVPQGHVRDIRYIVYVDPWRYGQLPDYASKLEIARVVGRLNKRLEGERFIVMGPGRWGSSNVNLGVKVTYADIFNASVLVEVATEYMGESPEASYGTHFFQDLVEAQIYPLALYPLDGDADFSRSFFEKAANSLEALLPADAQHADFIRVIDVPAVAGGSLLEVIMNGEQEQALGFLTNPQ